MISQRAARPSGSVEKLRQLSLSNLRGVDETRAPTDPYSVDSAVNLVSNSDGSLSIRKPLLIERDWTRIVSTQAQAECNVLDVVPLYTETDYFIRYTLNTIPHVAIYNSVQNVFKPFALCWTDAKGYAHTVKNFSESKNVCETITFGNVQPFHTSESTVFGDCTVWLTSTQFKTDASENYFLCDPTLYDKVMENGISKVYGTRYVYLAYGTEDLVWKMYIYNASPNIWEAEGEVYVHPEDTVLDNMYSITDEYEKPIPAVTHIVPYATVKQSDFQQVFEEINDDVAKIDNRYVSSVDESWDTACDLSKVTSLGPEDIDPTILSPKHIIASETTEDKELLWEMCFQTEYTLFREGAFGDDGYVSNTVTDAKDIQMWQYRNFIWIDVHSSAVRSIQLQRSSVDTSLCIERTVMFANEQKYLARKQTHLPNDRWTQLSKGDRIYLYTDAEHNQVQISKLFSVLGSPYPIKQLRLNTHIDVSTVQITTSTTVSVEMPHTPVSKITMDARKNAFKGVSLLPDGFNSFYLKAFCKFRHPDTFVPLDASKARTFQNVYATWLYTFDGINWSNAISAFDGGHDSNVFPDTVVITESVDPVKSVQNATPPPGMEVVYAPFDALGYYVSKTDSDVTIKRADSIDATRIRIDFLKISDDFFKISDDFSKNPFTNATFRFKIVLVESAYAGSEGWKHTILSTYSQEEYTLPRDSQGEAWFQDFNNSASGNKLYYNRRIFSFGDATFGTKVFVSHPGSYTTPMSNTLSVNASQDTTVTTVVPWKDYLFVSTPQALYLATQVENGFLTKTVNASIGIPIADRKCAVPTLNGMLFKSGSKVYLMYPNLYAGDDSVANVTTISDPVESVLESSFSNVTGTSFAFGTNSEYVLMVPEAGAKTTCFKYNYSTRLWNCIRYPIVIEKCVVYSLTDIRIFGRNTAGSYCEYHYDKSFKDAYGIDAFENAPYGDILSESENGIADDIQKFAAGTSSAITVTPIEFELDTGQKSDQILTKKQFVETKIVLSTDSHAPAIDMQCTVHVGGNASIVVKDISTDSAFWKKETGGMVLNTSGTGFGNADAKNVLRQIVLRYSGKGNSIRHIITGKSLSNFSLYETYVRYKLLNVKQ